ncbi:MAG: tyrosine-protein phosphatase [Gemmataceae bacterium]
MASGETQPHPTTSLPQSRQPSRRWIKRGVLVVVCFAGFCLLAEIVRVLGGRNFHTVIPGKIYRSAQPNLSSLKDYVARHGIRTVVNLRGCSPPLDWYSTEANATAELDLCQEDLYLSAGRLPPVSEIRDLIEILDRAEYPILFHCRRGADRTGIASVVALLLKDDISYQQARRQLSSRYAHIPLGHPGFMAEFFDFYEHWLEERQLEHSPNVFRQWALHEYGGGQCGCRFEEYQLPKMPLEVGKPFVVKVRVRNTGCRPWQFSPFRNVGQHVVAIVRDDYRNPYGGGRGGLYDAIIPPGESVDVVVPVSPIQKPGKYRLTLDMIDEKMASFFQVGSEPIELRLEVR